MEQARLTEEDLVPCIGSLAMVKEVLAGIRPLTMEMAKALDARFGMSIEVLINNHKGGKKDSETQGEL
jgi:antitoxin component HigA of HigAB toxin-antitoxin module